MAVSADKNIRLQKKSLKFIFVFLILAVVFLVKTGNDIKCVLKSQIIRILAYLLPFVKSNDIIVTAGMVYFCNVCRSELPIDDLFSIMIDFDRFR